MPEQDDDLSKQFNDELEKSGLTPEQAAKIFRRSGRAVRYWMRGERKVDQLCLDILRAHNERTVRISKRHEADS